MKKAQVTGIRVLRLGALAALLLRWSRPMSAGKKAARQSLDKDVAVG